MVMRKKQLCTEGKKQNYLVNYSKNIIFSDVLAVFPGHVVKCRPGLYLDLYSVVYELNVWLI